MLNPIFQPADARVPSVPRVLIVKPEKSYLGVLARRIAENGYRIAIAETVQAAVAELYRQPVDIILCELRGPSFNGTELLGIIREDAILRDIPFLLFAGRSDRPAAIQALRNGADAIVNKPFHFEVLSARIARELQRKRAIEDLRRSNRTLDARVVERAIAVGELKDRLASSEAERRRLEIMVAATSPQ